jgi:hypothetical protein
MSDAISRSNGDVSMDDIQPIKPSPAARSALGGATALFLLAALFAGSGVVLLALGQLPALALLVLSGLLIAWALKRTKQVRADGSVAPTPSD